VHVNLNQVHEEWVKTVAAQQIHEAAEYYNVFEDLFGEAFFYPVVPLKVLFEYEEDPSFVTPVYRGNLIKPSEVGNVLIICH
jgi:large subunit ribosomal protein L38